MAQPLKSRSRGQARQRRRRRSNLTLITGQRVWCEPIRLDLKYLGGITLKKNTKATILSLVVTGLVVGVIVSKLGKKQNKNKISSIDIGDIRDYKEFFDGRENCHYGGTMLL